MSNVLEDSLFVSQNKKFDEIQSIVRQFSAEYVGNSIIKDNIFAVIQNYARKKEIALEMLRYPIHDDELWALTFLKQDTIFVCVNTALPLCKQFFAAAHELYHIYCYVENADQSYIKNGSMLDSATGDETGRTQEDLEANAFAGLLLMPDQLLHEQILLYGLDKDLVTVDSVLMLMDKNKLAKRFPKSAATYAKGFQMTHGRLPTNEEIPSPSGESGSWSKLQRRR